ncbi:MAG: hypothetical protein JSU69_05820, partial [Candidatus Zixiibacteriota bacterium]
AGGQAPADPDDRLTAEWKECRKSIERFDKIIVDLRKYGFTLVTGLVTASAYFFGKAETLSFADKAAASFVITVLIFALYTIDRCHENFLRGAVDRAKDIESKLDMGLSIVISKFSRRAKTDTHGKILYSLFVVGTAIPLFAAADLDDPASGSLLIVYASIAFMFLVAIRERYEIARRKSDRTVTGTGDGLSGRMRAVRWGKWLALTSVAIPLIRSYTLTYAVLCFLAAYAITIIVLLVIEKIRNDQQDKENDESQSPPPFPAPS